MQRVAVIFDNQHRPETTGLYCLCAFEKLVRAGHLKQIRHVLPSQLATIRPTQFDLFLFVDDGIQRSIPDHLHPAIWWGIDTHLEFDRCLAVANSADLVFAAQKDGATRFVKEGIASAAWLPLGCDPDLHGRRTVKAQWDVAFVGHNFPGERRRLLELVLQCYPRMFVGQCFFEQMAETYSASKVVFNRSIANDINMRVFEGLCSGSLLLTNDLAENGFEELFQDGLHCATYRSDEELLSKLAFYLKHPRTRENVAHHGTQLVLSQHTYLDRMRQVLGAATNWEGAKPTTVSMSGKDRFYFECDRRDVLELVPHSAKRILDLGCGAGRLGWSLKQRQSCEVVGVERDLTAASIARERMDEVVVADVTDHGLQFGLASFDCVICADILEHTRHPERVLQRVRGWLKPDGCLITSLPNIRNHSVVRSLLAGNWTYEAAGLLDEDHVRFFTRREIEKLLFRTGFDVECWKINGGTGYQEWVDAGRPKQVAIGPFQVCTASVQEAEEFFAYQFLTRSTVRECRHYGLTSIVIVTHNQLAYTKECLDSIRQRTTVPYEIIVVDNASTDATVDYLLGCGDVTLIQNDKNRGFPAAANQGIHAASGAQIVLLNNDTIVTTGWLQRMLDGLNSDAAIGAVGPLSNRVSGPQQIEVTYDDLAQLDGFAWDLAQRNRKRYLPTDRLVGFCLLFRRTVIETIGLLDERFGVGNFEDDDFCRRMDAAGYRCAIVADSFVHHFGSVTFRATNTDLGGLLKQNRKLFEDKWQELQQGHDLTVPNAVHRNPRPQFLVDVGEDSSLLLKKNHIHLSACLIVRDNEETIRPCLESLSPWVDEIIVVDTGSQDSTPKICEEIGARVYHWPWCDDFAAARNESLRYAFGEWIFWMDSDDTLPAECGRQLRSLADGYHPEDVLGYVMQVHCPGENPVDVTVVDHIKLFRNRPDIHFEFRIHEQVLPSIRRVGGAVARTDIYVVHSGSDRSTAGQQRKRMRDLRLLEWDLAEHPDHPFVLFNLGMTHNDGGNHELAVRFLEECRTRSQPEESHLRKAYALLVHSYFALNQVQLANERCQQALGLFPDDVELRFRQALLAQHQGELGLAESLYRRLLAEPGQEYFRSLDHGIATFKAAHNLGIVLQQQGQNEAAAESWMSALKCRFDFWPSIRALGDLILNESAPAQIEILLKESGLSGPSRAFLDARLAERCGDPDRAVGILRTTCHENPQDEQLLDEYCRVLFEKGADDEAAHALVQLTRLSPHHAPAWHNLSVVQFRLGHVDEAEESVLRSLEIRPEYKLSMNLLAEIRQSVLCQSDDVELIAIVRK